MLSMKKMAIGMFAATLLAIFMLTGLAACDTSAAADTRPMVSYSETRSLKDGLCEENQV